jgi:hypothetical protein
LYRTLLQVTIDVPTFEEVDPAAAADVPAALAAAAPPAADDVCDRSTVSSLLHAGHVACAVPQSCKGSMTCWKQGKDTRHSSKHTIQQLACCQC